MFQISSHLSQHNQPVGVDIPPVVVTPISDDAITGNHCSLHRLDPAKHLDDLWDAYSLSPTESWTYLFAEKPQSKSDLEAWLVASAATSDPHTFTIKDSSGKAVGVASFMRIDNKMGTIEVGGITMSSALQNTIASTEAMYLMMKTAFEHGYRRYEWKCNVLNAPSIAAAHRLGFSFEGVWRQAMTVKGQNRDTAWFSVIDSEWVELKAKYELWLDPANFDEDGQQQTRLSVLTSDSVVARFPDLHINL
jgi:RimJ/RimL family protein N-acetyltransferase